MSTDSTSNCQLCGRPLRREQSVCMCGVLLRTPGAAAGQSMSKFDYGLALPWVPVLGIICCIWLIAYPASIQYSWMPLFKIYGVISILSAVLAMLTAERIARQQWDYSDLPYGPLATLSGLTPVSWFIGVAAVWPLFFPAFLYVHYRRTFPQRFRIGAIVALIFVILLGYCLVALRGRVMVWPTDQSSSNAAAKISKYKSGQSVQNAMPIYPDEGTAPLVTPAQQAIPTPQQPPAMPSGVRTPVPAAPAAASGQNPAAPVSPQGSAGSGGSSNSGNIEPTYGIAILKNPKGA